MSDKSVKVYISTYNTPILDRLLDGWHEGIQAGAERSEDDMGYLRDDSGDDNISGKNYIYSELSAYYWLWKHAPRTDYIGVECYRRHFNLPKEQVTEVMKDYDIIVPRPLDLKRNNREYYSMCHVSEMLDICEKVLKREYPEYAEDYDRYIANDNLLYYGDSYITTWENFNAINEFMFTVLGGVEKEIGLSSMDEWREYMAARVPDKGADAIRLDTRKSLSNVDYQMLFMGFLAERLLTLYIRHNFRNVYTVQYEELEEEYRVRDMRIMLCCIGRMENRYIREFVDHYRKMGVDRICLYDNNRDGEEDFRDVIADDIDSGFVILKDCRNRTDCQQEAYNSCYAEYGGEYDWIMFFDIDEFMFVNGGMTLREYLSKRNFDRYEVIYLNWLNYGDNGLVRDDGRPLSERFTVPLNPELRTTCEVPDDFHVKSIVRGNLNDVVWGKKLWSHSPEVMGRCCNSNSAEVRNDSMIPYDLRAAGLRHYCTKTAEEYAGKILRGFPDGTAPGAEFMVDLFFMRNEVTPEKVELFKEKLGIDKSSLLPHRFEGEKRKDVRIFSLCYEKKKFRFLDDAVVTPLQVGAANGTDVCELKDNTGDNISGKNYFFIENTGIYWIWKNVTDAKYVGQMQYRRPLKGVDESMDFDAVFADHDVITCVPFHHPDHKVPTAEEPMVISADTVEQGYAFSNCVDDLYILEMAVKMYMPEYRESWDRYIKNGEDLYYSNGFVLRREDYDRYCEFLFTALNGYLKLSGISSEKELLEHVRYNIEVGKYPRYAGGKNIPEQAVRWQCAIGGFLSERLWTLWLRHNFEDSRIYRVPYVKMEANMYT